jgi:hypothetical protein
VKVALGSFPADLGLWGSVFPEGEPTQRLWMSALLTACCEPAKEHVGLYN